MHVWFNTPHYITCQAQFRDNTFNMRTPVQWIIYIYTKELYIWHSCYWIIVANNIYVSCGFIFSFKLNTMGFINVYWKQICSKPLIYTKGVNHIIMKIFWIWAFDLYACVISLGRGDTTEEIAFSLVNIIQCKLGKEKPEVFCLLSACHLRGVCHLIKEGASEITSSSHTLCAPPQGGMWQRWASCNNAACCKNILYEVEYVTVEFFECCLICW
jgi:hypothetical protein